MILEKNQFKVRDDITFLNNGSFGCLPKVIYDKQNQYSELMEENPVEFFLNIAPNLMEQSLFKLSQLLNCSTENLVFVDNATSGVNTILNSLLKYYASSVEIAFFNSIYPAVRNQLQYYKKHNGVKLNEIYIDYPATKQEIIDEFEASLNKCTNIAIIDHISSSTATIFPVEELVEICSARGITSIIDGAHSVGQIELDFSKMEYDFYVSNCHKWLFAPRGCCFLWINDLYKDLLHPLTISLFYEQGLKKEFYWLGTKDITQFLTVSDSIDFVNSIGLDIIIKHNKGLNDEAADLFSDFNRGLVADKSLTAAMTTHYLCENTDLLKLTGNDIRGQFYNKYKIEVPFFVFDNKVWFRTSSQIFNKIEEYEYLRECLAEFINF